MKRFLSQIFIFFLIPVALIAGLVQVIHSKIGNLKIHADVSEVYMGDSHVQYAIYDSLLVHSQNIANESESYYFSYYKLKLVLESNPHIKTIYLGYSYHNLSAYYDDFIYGKYCNAVSPNYFFILPWQEKIKMVSLNIHHLQDYFKNLVIVSSKILSNELPFAGGYTNPFSDAKAVKSSMDGRSSFQFYEEKRVRGFSSYNLLYLNKIIALCQASKIDLVLLDTPLHPYYQSKIPGAYLDRYRALADSTGLKLIDLSDLELPDSCYIPDGDHVSALGAYRATLTLVR